MLMPRVLNAGQRSRIMTLDVDSGEVRVLHESTDVLYEAPNWSVDGSELYLNGDGYLFRLGVDSESVPSLIDLPGLPELNNDHVLDPDGVHIFVSAQDRHIYRVPLRGGEAVRVTNEGHTRMHFLHGVSPDGVRLTYIGIDAHEEGSWGVGNVFTIPAVGGADVQITNDEFPDDGAEYSPDGAWIYFNSERASTRPGHAQLFRMRLDGTGIEQLTTDDRVNWFPHVSPDGNRLAYISFSPGTLGHPENRDVILRLSAADGTGVKDLRYLFGGQGTMNVPSWSPDSTRIAFVEYPLEH